MKKKFIKKIMPLISGYVIGAVIAGAIIHFGFHESVQKTVLIVGITTVIMSIAAVTCNWNTK